MDSNTPSANAERPTALPAAAPGSGPTREQRMYDALKRIAGYAGPDYMRRHSEKDFGLDPSEAIEMAYENVITEAKRAIKGMRRPK